MKLIFVIIVILFSALLWADLTHASDSLIPLYQKESELATVLLQNYDPEIIPIVTVKQPVVVGMTLAVLDLLEVNEKEGFIVVSAYTRMNWTDERLRWNDTYPFDDITLFARRVWLPDIEVYNSIQNALESFVVADPKVLVKRDGQVFYVPHQRIKTHCNFNLVSFPYDMHRCSIHLGAWASSEDQYIIKVENAENSTVAADLINDWTLTGLSVNGYSSPYPLFNKSYSTVHIDINMSRRGSYYYRLFVAPAAVCMFVIPIIHFVPPSSNEKLTLGGLMLVAVTIMFEMLEDFFPPFSLGNIPLLLHYYTALLMILFMSLLLSCLSVMIGTGDTKSSRVPRILRKCCIDKLGYICCARGRTARYDYELLHLEKSLRFAASHQDDNEFTDSADVTDADTPAQGTRNENAVQDDGMKEVLKTLINELQYVRYKEQIKSEWAQLAIVIDRIGAVMLLSLSMILTAVVTMHSKPW